MPLALLLAGCLITDAEVAQAQDRDGDGHVAAEVGGDDCDDADPAVHPGAFESCLDSIDSDCDTLDCPPRTEVTWAPGSFWVAGRDPGVALQPHTATTDLDGDGHAEVLLYEPGTPDPDGVSGDPLGAAMVFVLEAPLPERPELSRDSLAVYEISTDGAGWPHPIGDLDGDGRDELVLSTRGLGGISWVVSGDEGSQLLTRDTPDSWSVLDDGSDGRDIVYGDVLALADWGAADKAAYVLMAPGVGAADRFPGKAFLLDGFPDGQEYPQDAALAVFEGSQDHEQLGSPVGLAPDVDCDGHQDVLLSAATWDLMQENRPDPQVITAGVGAVMVWTDVPGFTNLSEDADLLIRGKFAESPIAHPTAIGDVNGDGCTDLAVAQSSGPGDFFVFYGGRAGRIFMEDADLRLYGDAGETPTAGFGSTVTPVGDLDGDHRDEVLIGAPQEGVGANPDEMPPGAGAVYLFHGPISGVLGPDHASVRWEGAEPVGQLGITTVGEFDGLAGLDLLFGAPSASPDLEGGPNQANGMVYLRSAELDAVGATEGR